MAIDAPTNCPVCGAALSHDSDHRRALRLTARVFECGAAVCIADGGRLYPALGCPKSSAVIAELRAEVSRLRAEGVRVGDRNVLLATELQAIADAAGRALGEWFGIELIYLPERLHALHTVYDLATEALAGEPSAPAVEAPHEPGQGSAALSISAAGHVGERSLKTP